MGLELFCAIMIALLFGLVVCFGGYRLFLALLPIWGFFFGFGLGAQTMAVLFGQELFATVTGWVVGFFVGLVFALLSYLFYIVAVAIAAGSLGYGLGIALMSVFNLTTAEFLTWLVAIALAAVLVVVTLYFNLQKYVIIIATAVGGAGLVASTIAVGIGGTSLLQFSENPIQTLFDMNDSWLLVLLFIVMAGAGIVLQIQANRSFEVEQYNRLEGMM